MRECLLFAATTLFCFLTVFQLPAQQDQLRPLPIDTNVRYGKLNNGLTYYIRHNELPKDRADFYIAQNVGSILEDENQRGLAHFLEHMAFNGTKNFPDHRIEMFTESIGMRGGENLNAYTSFDETVYMIMDAPVTRKGIVDSCLLILHDWSGFITLADTAIEKERGVIREEWRTTQDAQARLWAQQLPKMFPDSRYANRLPIGSIDVINTFKPDELRAYYHKWYRPDLQAIIIVGDVHVDQMEADIKKIFADIPTPVNPAKREVIIVPDNDMPLISIAKDKEATRTTLSVFYKHEKIPQELYSTTTGLVKDYIQSVTATMMNERFNELLNKASPPFVAGSAYDGDFMIARTKEAWTVSAFVKEEELDSALTALVTETERVKQFGFTASEYDRARINILKQYESAYNERDNRRNSDYSNEYIRHFTNGMYIPGIETEYALINQIAPSIPVGQVNKYIQDIIGEKNIVIGLSGPDKKSITHPTEEQLLRSFMRAQQIPVEPYKEVVSTEPLISSLPIPGTIKDARIDPLFGVTVLTLSNGVKVILKQTDFKLEEILMTATSPGGSSLFSKADISNLSVLDEVISLGGLGSFPATELNKVLAGKQVSCYTTLGSDYESISGFCAPADRKTLFELIYLYFTAPRMDKKAYTSFENRMKAQLKNRELDPMVIFRDSLTKALYNNNPYTVRFQISDFKQVSYDRILEMYKQRYCNASDFVFTFVGNLSLDSIRPYIEQYLATLPSKARVEKGNPDNMPAFRKGDYRCIFKHSMETPKASVANIYSGTMDYTLENCLIAIMLEQILDLIFIEKIREDESGTYGVQTSLGLSSFPEGETILQVYFDTDPAKREKMNSIVRNELKRIKEAGPRPEDFKKSQDNMLKRHEENLQENSYWLNTLDNYYYKGFDGATNYKELLQNMTPEKIKTFARKFLDQGNSIEVVMEP